MKLVRRDDSDDTSYSPSMVTLLIVLLVLVIISLLAGITLLYMRYRQKMRTEESLPMYHEKRPSSSRSNHRRLNIRPSESYFVYQEKQQLLAESDRPVSPSSPVPEIRITFPEEVDTFGKRQSGRVVVVHVGETGIGMEPHTESLPAYQQSESDRFQSLDLERIGGLKEKEIEARWH